MRKGEFAYKGLSSRCYLDDVERRKAEKAGRAAPAPKESRGKRAKPAVDQVELARAMAHGPGMESAKEYLASVGVVDAPRVPPADLLSLPLGRCRSGFCLTGDCGACKKAFSRDPDGKSWLRCPCDCHGWPAAPPAAD
jgi:hypothetical protein